MILHIHEYTIIARENVVIFQNVKSRFSHKNSKGVKSLTINNRDSVVTKTEFDVDTETTDKQHSKEQRTTNIYNFLLLIQFSLAFACFAVNGTQNGL